MTNEELSAYHKGRRECRKAYAESNLLVLNPDIDWEEELKNPCEECEHYTTKMLIGCNIGKMCNKYKRYSLVCEINEHFKTIDEYK